MKKHSIPKKSRLHPSEIQMVLEQLQNRAFLQGIILRKCMLLSDAQALYSKACQLHSSELMVCTHRILVDASPSRFQETLTLMNKQLDSFGFNLKTFAAHDSGLVYLSLVNTLGDELAQLATECSPSEIQTFKKWVFVGTHLIRQIDLIVNHSDFEISSTTALQESSSIRPCISKKDAEKLLERLVSDHWLSMNK